MYLLQYSILHLRDEMLILSLLKAKVIILFHQYRVRPACTFIQSDQALYCWMTNLKFSS